MIRPILSCATLIAGLLLPAVSLAGTIGTCGGGGGPQSKTLSCPAGEYVVGLSARGGSYIDRIGIRCAGFDAAGLRGSLGAWRTAGGSGGSVNGSGVCNGNRAIASVFASGGAYLDGFRGGLCVGRLVTSDGGFAPVPSPVPSGTPIVNFTVGGFGGSGCGLVCPEGEAVHRIIVRYGSWIDSIEVFCRP